MREVEFRGKNKYCSSWIVGYYYEKNGIVKIKNDYQDLEVDAETIGQYTGLKDKNGIKVFEGDIVRATSQLTGKSDRYCLVFDETRLHFGFRVSRHGYFYNIDELLSEELGDEIDFEVIGNIYDNPELLEVADGEKIK